MDPDADPLLSVSDVARFYGTGTRTVLDLVSRGSLPTLDGGMLVSHGHHQVPLIRKSWAVALQEDSPGGARRIGLEEAVHAAVAAAMDFHDAYGSADPARLEQACSLRSRAATANETMERWKRELGHLDADWRAAGIGTVIYDLAPISAVAARVIADAPALPRAVEAPTPVTMLTALPLVHEDNTWRVDLELFKRRDEWLSVLAPPASVHEDEPA